MSAVAIRVENLGKRYLLRSAKSNGPYRTLREELRDLPSKIWKARERTVKAEQDIFWALNGVTFQVAVGEVLGVIGRNGAGKSTLLKILSRIVAPSAGTVDMFGRVGSLLEVGTGFHPELTGRENVYLSGALLGMRRAEVSRHFDEIVSFAEVEKFVDTPCKFYSSGMYARLGFSVAAHLDAEILIVDEVLSVGDAEFRERCQRKVKDVALSQGRTVVIVSHDLALVRALCDRTAWLDSGGLHSIGSTPAILDAYYKSRLNGAEKILPEAKTFDDGFVITQIKVGGSELRRLVLAKNTREISVEIWGTMETRGRAALEVRLFGSDGTVLAFFSPAHQTGIVETYEAGAFRFFSIIRMPALLQGEFSLGIEITDPNHKSIVDLGQCVQLQVEGISTGLGVLTAGSHCGWQMLELPQVSDGDP